MKKLLEKTKPIVEKTSEIFQIKGTIGKILEKFEPIGKKLTKKPIEKDTYWKNIGKQV